MLSVLSQQKRHFPKEPTEAWKSLCESQRQRVIHRGSSPWLRTAPALLPHFCRSGQGPQPSSLSLLPSTDSQIWRKPGCLGRNGSAPAAYSSPCLKPLLRAEKENGPAWPAVGPGPLGPAMCKVWATQCSEEKSGWALGGILLGSALRTPQDEDNCQRNALCGRGGGAEGKSGGGRRESRKGKRGESSRGKQGRGWA